MRKRTMPFVFSIALCFAGCGDNSPIQWRGFSNESGALDARNVDQSELELCRLQLDPTTFYGNSGLNANNSSRSSNPSSGGFDPESRLFGDSGGNSNSGSDAGDSQSSINRELERIVSLRVLEWDDRSAAAVSAISSRDVILHTGGVAQVVRMQYDDNNSLQRITEDRASVNLDYHLTRNGNGWRCLGVSATLFEEEQEGKPYSESVNPRIGW